jgi:hypothetical protein
MEIHTMALTFKDDKPDGFMVDCLCGWSSGVFVTYKQLADDYKKNGRSVICKKIFAEHHSPEEE